MDGSRMLEYTVMLWGSVSAVILAFIFIAIH